jgi:hypothetical protein
MSKETSVPANTSLNKVYCADAGLEFLAPAHMNTSNCTSVRDVARAE